METQMTQGSQQSRATSAGSEAEIKKLLDEYASAFRDVSLDRLFALFSLDIVAYDMIPPLQYSGRDSYAKAWREAAGMMNAPWIWEVQDEKIYAGDDVAFAHHLVKCGGTDKDGKQSSGWIRHTIGFRKINGQWLVVHDQFSVPIDMKSRQGLMDLTPEQGMH